MMRRVQSGGVGGRTRHAVTGCAALLVVLLGHDVHARPAPTTRPTPTRRHGRPRFNTYWYRLDARVDARSLPRGVSVEVVPSQFGDQLALRWRNRSPTPLVLTRRLARPLAWIGLFPRNTLPMFKLVGGEVLEWTNEGWNSLGQALSTDELYAAHGLRPFELEFKRRPLPRGRGSITRRVRIPYYTTGLRQPHVLTGTVVFDVDYDSQALLANRDRLDPIPAGRLLVYARGALTNPHPSPVYFTTRLQNDVDWIGALPADEVPCYRLQRGQVAFTVTPSHPSARGKAVSHGWYHDRTERFVELPITWFARRAGVSLHLEHAYHRPRTLPIPPAQTLAIPVRLGDRPHIVRVAVRYAVNPDFRGQIGDR